MLHIALVSATTEKQKELLRTTYDCELHDFSKNRDGLAEQGDVIEVVLGNVRPFELPKMTALKWIQATWAGVENLTYPQMKQSGIIVSNVRGQCATSMSEHAIAGLFYFARELHRHVLGCQRNERTSSKSPFLLTGSTVCVLGTGGIGKTLVSKLAALGFKVVGVNSTGTPTDECPDMFTLETITGELGNIDHVVCTLPATRHTHQYIDKSFLMGLKPNACIVNISRGALINETDLVECIDSGQIYGALLDVSSPEPPPADSPLWNNPKILFTSHSSAAPYGEPGKSGFDVFWENLEYYVLGAHEKMINVVDFDMEY